MVKSNRSKRPKELPKNQWNTRVWEELVWHDVRKAEENKPCLFKEGDGGLTMCQMECDAKWHN